MVLTVEVTGLTHRDLELGLTEVIFQIASGFLEGRNRNESGKYHFNIK